jgi:hypothetical protein
MAGVQKRTIEECAALVERSQETFSETHSGSRRHLTPRNHGNSAGLAYADGIRALANLPPAPASQDSPTRPDGLGGELERELCGDELNGGLIRDLCFTVWSICHNPTHADGNSDWGSDTFPTVQKAVGAVRAKLKAALSANPAPAAVGVSREEIARIIDPTAFDLLDELAKPENSAFPGRQEADAIAWTKTNAALAKADTILALSSLPAGGEG